MENVTLQNGMLTVEISPLGAELQRVTDAGGMEWLWDGDPAFWSGRAPILFPVAGALKEDRYTLAGKAYAMDRHGFASGRQFQMESQSAISATFLLAGEASFHAGFPFAYALRARYALEGRTLHVAYTVDNLGDETFYYSTGAHEAYACPEGIGACQLVFEKEEPLARCVLAGAYLSGKKEALPMQGKVLPLHDGYFEGGNTIVLDDLASRSVTLRNNKNARSVRVDFADYPYLLIWKVPGANYLCIEPWGNLPDAVDADGDITHKPGMIRLAPGEQHTQTHDITFVG